MEGEAAYEPSTAAPTYSYDEVFPALPESAPGPQTTSSQMGQWSTTNNKMRVGSSVVTQVFRVPYEERKMDMSERFGEGDSKGICQDIMGETGAHIEISQSKDQSLTFLVTGKQTAVLDARRKILTHFQTQASTTISIPKEYHRFILGKGGNKLKELEKNTATKISIPPTADSSDKIVITGTKEGIEKAVHEIRVTSDEQSKQAYERLEVPKIYHPFIAGAHNEKVNALMSETGVRINIPPLSVQKDEITIAGEKEGVMLSKQRILSVFNEMAKKCATVSVEVIKSQHKYVIGPKGSSIAEILQETGVSVEMPPSDTPNDTITLRGPQDKLGQALSMVYLKANSVRTTTVSAPAWIHKYIIGRKGANIKQITQDLPKVHVEFTDITDKEGKIRIEGPPEEVETAQKSLEDLVRNLIGTLTFEEIVVDPKFYKHIIGKAGVNINRIKEETNVIINISDNDGKNIIRIEGNKEGVANAKRELEEMVHKLENEKERDIIIDRRFYKSLIGSKGERIREVREKFNQVQITIPGPGDKRDVVKIRGAKEDVDKCYRHMQKLVKELGESSHVLEVPIYKQFHKYIIGKGGANIRKIRDETQARIDLPGEGEKSDVITITGKKESVEEARDKIQKIQNDMANIVSEDITIPPKHYNSLIGAGGKLIHAIMDECGGVTIKFPPTDSNSDKVTIRGPKDDVEKAKQQLLELVTERQLSGFTAEVRAKAQHHKFLIGRNGVNIKKIRDSTGARIIFPTDKDEDKEVITIVGKKDSVEKAKAELEATIKEIDNIVESDMCVDPKHHRHFVARRGEVLHQIADQYGGVMISFPRAGITSDKVVLKGSKDCVEGAKQRIKEIVHDLESMIAIECIIPQKHHRTVMGAKGFKVQGITQEFDVQIKFPERENFNNGEQEEHVNGDGANRPCDTIRITGKQENCAKAKQALLDLVPVTIEVNVPYEYHRSIIGQKGRDVREMMEKYDVHIVLSPADQKLDVIKITGAPSAAASAKEAVEERCKQLEEDRADRQLRSFELKLEVDPDFHPKIIGKRGAVITKIRQDHDVQINFPKKGDPEEHIITITGYEKNTEAAKEDIMRIVNELNKMVKEQVSIDHRVHARLIGQRGRAIHKVMELYNVDIKFPRSTDPDPSLVSIIGAEENVAEAKESLLNQAEEYMQDVNEQLELEQYTRPSTRSDKEGGAGANPGETGFVVKGAPWEQSTPNTSSIEDFPSFGGDNSGTAAPAAPSTSGPWGPRR